jgi:hypothetical protein
MLAVAAVGTIFVGSYIYSQGLIRVSVQEKRPGGDHIHLAIPGAIVPLVMAFVPAGAIGKHLQIPAEARKQLPVVEAALTELRKLPDCTLVEVEEPGEHVRVEVRSGSLVVDVKDPEDEVHVTLPMGSVASVLSKVERAVELAAANGDDSAGSSHTSKAGWHRPGCRYDGGSSVVSVDDDDDSSDSSDSSDATDSASDVL